MKVGRGLYESHLAPARPILQDHLSDGGVMVGPGQHWARECCLTEDNYQLCIITCVAGHRGHRQGWKLGTMRVTIT